MGHLKLLRIGIECTYQVTDNLKMATSARVLSGKNSNHTIRFRIYLNIDKIFLGLDRQKPKSYQQSCTYPTTPCYIFMEIDLGEQKLCKIVGTMMMIDEEQNHINTINTSKELNDSNPSDRENFTIEMVSGTIRVTSVKKLRLKNN